MDIDEFDLPEREFDTKRVCDGCATGLDEGDYAIVYLSDRCWVAGEELTASTIEPREIYCRNCNRGEVPLPHQTSNEACCLVQIEFYTGSRVYSYDWIEIVDGSNSESGIIWNPDELVEQFMPYPIEVSSEVTTPASVFNLFFAQGVDLRGFIKDGRIQIPDEVHENVECLLRATRDTKESRGFTPENMR